MNKPMLLVPRPVVGTRYGTSFRAQKIPDDFCTRMCRNPVEKEKIKVLHTSSYHNST